MIYGGHDSNDLFNGDESVDLFSLKPCQICGYKQIIRKYRVEAITPSYKSLSQRTMA